MRSTAKKRFRHGLSCRNLSSKAGVDPIPRVEIAGGIDKMYMFASSVSLETPLVHPSVIQLMTVHQECTVDYL